MFFFFWCWYFWGGIRGIGYLMLRFVGNVFVDVKFIVFGWYNVLFIFNKFGEYNIYFVFNGDDILGSLVKMIVSDFSWIVVYGDGLY